MKTTKLNSGNYRAQVIVGYNENGKRIVKSFIAKTEWEAIKLAEDFKTLHVDITPTKITVKEAVKAYIDSKRNVIAPTTLYGYESLAKNRLLSIHGHMLTDLKIIDIQRAINIDAQQGMSHKTLNLRMLFSEVLHCSLMLSFLLYANLGFLLRMLRQSFRILIRC